MSSKRNIFEEVSGDQGQAAKTPTPGLIDQGRGRGRSGIRLWLMVLFAMVALMIVVGGLTRLTDSGLSITEWNLVTGVVPPLNEADWAMEFVSYQAIPEFRLQNSSMDLAEFKVIYYWEWGHRFLGRMVGLVWFVGFLFFLATKRIPTGWTGKLLGLGALGGLQGAIGWWMVSSGLTGERVDVASYRLAVHLGLAFAILGLIAWYVLVLGRKEADLLQARRGREGRLFSITTGLLHLTFLQVLLGALVAGIDAGRSFTDWPLMGGNFFPEGAFDLTPFWRNFFEEPGLVQFMHRICGYLVLIFAFVVWRRSRDSGNLATRRAVDWVLVMIFGQMVLGIGTVLYAAPLSLAIVHQIGAILAFVLILRARFLAGYPVKQSVRGGGQ